jgi:hypothetical protein
MPVTEFPELLGHGLLVKLDRFDFYENFDLHLAIGGGVEEEFGGGGRGNIIFHFK